MEVATCEKIIVTIDKIFRKDPFLDEFDIIYSSGEVNKSPVIHVDHKLALESWCVKYIYDHAYSSAFRYCNSRGNDNAAALIRWTQVCLLIVPEVLTFWNMRKKMVKRNQLHVNADFILSKLILTRKPKCIEAFQHRRWLFDCILFQTNQNSMHRCKIINNNNFQTDEYLRDILLSELQLCTWTANRKQNNYHSWNHRIWVLDLLTQSSNIFEIYSREYGASHEWISFHVSEHSGMHYHVYLLGKIAQAHDTAQINIENLDKGIKNVEKLFKKELDFNKELMTLYPGHESLFYLRRVILSKLYSLIGNTGQTASSPSPALKRSCIETLNEDWNTILKEEIDIFDETICLPKQHYRLTEQHLNWVKNVIAF